MKGYKPVRADHPDNIKRGGACIYYKESLPVRDIELSYFKEALLLEMNYNNKNVIVSVIYRSPSEKNNEFNLFLSNHERLLCDINKHKPYLSIITGDFNARSPNWWSKDIDTPEGLKLFSLTSSNGFSQLINEPTHIQGNSSSCIDLIFTNKENLSVNSGVHTSLHPNCHHQITHSSFNFNIYYPPPYQRLIWDYKKADSIKIRKALDSVNWERLFGQADINEQVIKFNEVILNVFRNYVPNKYVIIDDKDPIWMNDFVKTKIKTKNILFKQCIKNGQFESDFLFLESIVNELNELISSTKALYYENLAKKINNPLLQVKTYWSILKTFYNDKKIPLIPPLLVDDKFVTDIQMKANIFNKFFAEQCTPLNNNSSLPVNQIFSTQSNLMSLDFNESELLEIIRALNINKAHGHDDISIRMIRICDKSLIKPLMLIFKKSIRSSCYPDFRKKSNIIPVHKKNDKRLVNNYSPISLLPVFGKNFEKIIFNRIYNHLLKENLLNPNQSGFRPSDSCINQLLAITHEIFKAFDCNPPLEVRSVFLDSLRKLIAISKWAFNWKMLFNPDPKKPAQEVLFSRKKQAQFHPTISLNNVEVERAPFHKRLGVMLDEKLNFKQHVDNAISKIKKGIAVIKKLRYSLPRNSLITIYKVFLRPLIDYEDIIYDQPHNESFCEKIESVQYKAALAITGAIQGTSRDKIYQELGLESLKSRRWYKRLACMFKIMRNEAPDYLINLVPKCEYAINTRNCHIPMHHCRNDCFKYSFFPSTLRDWFNIDEAIRNSESISFFKNKLLSFIRPVQNSIHNIIDQKGI